MPAADDVTVVIPTRGRSPFLREAVASSLAEAPAEVLVVEDGETGVDRRDVADARLLSRAHAGRSAARNAGVEASTTPFVAFLDDDDATLAGRLERQRAALLAPGAAASPLSFGAVHVVDAAGQPLEDWNRLLARRLGRLSRRGAGFAEILATRCPIYTSATMVRREAFLAAGGYDPALEAHEDLDLYLRLARLAPLTPCPGAPVTTYRLHGANTPSDRLYEGALVVVEKHLPAARGRDRRLLVERRLDALWGLGRFAAARRAAFGDALRDPRLLGEPRFAKRLAASTLPRALLERRRAA